MQSRSVPMDDAFVVEKVHGGDDLEQHLARVVFGVADALHDAIEEIATFQELHDDVDRGRRVVSVQHLDDVRLPEKGRTDVGQLTIAGDANGRRGTYVLQLMHKRCLL